MRRNTESSVLLIASWPTDYLRFWPVYYHNFLGVMSRTCSLWAAFAFHRFAINFPNDSQDFLIILL